MVDGVPGPPIAHAQQPVESALCLEAEHVVTLHHSTTALSVYHVPG